MAVSMKTIPIFTHYLTNTNRRVSPAHVVQWSNHLAAMCSRAWRSQWPRID